MPTNVEFIVVAEALHQRFGDVTALDGISIAVKPGEFLALLGPSGCGKTTLLRTIGGFIDPTSGRILIDGRDMAGTPPNRRPVNTVFQNYALFPHLSVADNIAFGPRRHGIAEDRIREDIARVLGLVGLEGYQRRNPGELSGGQQQRVALARAIINRPKVLLLDEPLGALDLKLRKRMQLELKQLQEHLGITFIFVTHDQEEALVMADRIAVMDHGKVIQMGTGEDIYRNPNCRFVASFIGEANLIAKGKNTSGQDVCLMVRPEDVVIGKAPSDQFAGESVILLRRLFVGDTVQVHAEFAHGGELVFHLPARQSDAHLAIGEKIDVHWPRERERILGS